MRACLIVVLTGYGVALAAVFAPVARLARIIDGR